MSIFLVRLHVFFHETQTSIYFIMKRGAPRLDFELGPAVSSTGPDDNPNSCYICHDNTLKGFRLF